MTRVAFTIIGEPASKANSRQLAAIGPRENRRMILRKGDKALDYEADALRQIPPRLRLRLEGPLRVTLRIWYASERPDLDESIVLDVMQDRWKRVVVKPETHAVTADGHHTVSPAESGRKLIQAGIYRNDRQVREKHVFWGLDRVNPRTEVLIEPLQPQQADAFAQIAEQQPA